MLEKSESDPRIIRNPLLSASVTGLTVEDFPNKPLLLPAAPPLEKASVSKDLQEECGKSVTVGQTPEIDTETLSEINLSSTADEEDYLGDLNDNLIQEPATQDSSILSQAASSFTQLPSVASTVLSTFSKVIKEYSPTSSLERKLDRSEEIKSFSTSPGISTDSNLNYQSNSEPPKFYSPADDAFLPPTTNCSLTPRSGNNYRLGAKRKAYAQIPNLCQTTDNNYQFSRANLTTSQSTLSNLQNIQSPQIQIEGADNNVQQKTDKTGEPFRSLVPLPWQNTSDLVTETSSKNSPSDLSSPPLRALPTTVSTLNIINASVKNNNVSTATNKISDELTLTFTEPSLSSGINFEVGNSGNLKQLTSESNKNISHFQGPPSKHSLGNCGSNTFRLQKGTRHYKSALISELPRETTPLFVQFPPGEQSKLHPTQSLPPDSNIISKSDKNVQSPAMEGISIYNPINPQEISPSFNHQKCFNQKSNEFVLNESNQNNRISYISKQNISEQKSSQIDVGHDKSILKDEHVCKELPLPDTKPEKSEFPELSSPEKSILTENAAVTPSERQIIGKTSTNIFENFPRACSSEEFSKFSKEEPEVQTTLAASTKKPENFLPINEASGSLKQPTTESFNLSNYFNTCNLMPHQQICESYENSSNPKKPVEVTAVENNTLLNLPPQINSSADSSSLTSTKKEAIDNSSTSTSVSALESDPLNFFDSFHDQTINQTREITKDSTGLRIQDFFNQVQSTDDSKKSVSCKTVGSEVNKRSENLPDSPASTIDRGALSPASTIDRGAFSPASTIDKEAVSSASSTVNHRSPNYFEFSEMPALLDSNSIQTEPYVPVKHHWFYEEITDKKHVWTPFSQVDSNSLEDNYHCRENGTGVVAVEGGRYDVNIIERTRIPVYWVGEPTNVRRCSWFYKALDSKYIPYEEEVADLLEAEYRKALENGEWHRKITLSTGDTVAFHGPDEMVHFLQPKIGSDVLSETTATPRIVKRDIEDFSINTGEPATADHLLFMVHGVGSACDLKIRSLEEVVDEFRSIALQLIRSQYKSSCDDGVVNRVEVLPVSWHSQLDSAKSGIDEKLKAITLESIPKLRNFTKDTLLDSLFYTSPIFSQNIMNTVCEALNKIYLKYCQRNPNFKGGVSLVGHGLSSLILFDLLSHQTFTDGMGISNSENSKQIVQPLEFSSQLPLSQQVSHTVDTEGTGQSYYPQLNFHPQKFFALGSPIGMFVTIRGIEILGLDFKFPTCSNFFHIFHPYDPIAYRIEPLINPDLSATRPVLIPHHKGRKRMHLELKETVTRVGADLEQKIVDAVKNKTEANEEIIREVDKVDKIPPRSRTNSTSTQSDADTEQVDLPLGLLNNNRRIDYVLQEVPLEFSNEYLLAFDSHVCYWQSEDTILFIMKEIYSSLGIHTDSQIPQQSTLIERPSTRPPAI